MAKMPFSVSQEESIRIADICCLIVAGEPRVLFDVGRYRDRLNIFQAAKAGALAPIQKLADGMVISDPRVLVANGNSKNSKYRLVASGPISAMSAGTWKDPALTRPKAVSVIGVED
jgi:hypothetical protein